jgi:hypothetical protein
MSRKNKIIFRGYLHEDTHNFRTVFVSYQKYVRYLLKIFDNFLF